VGAEAGGGCCIEHRSSWPSWILGSGSWDEGESGALGSLKNGLKKLGEA
jgi:hypothetical protein